VINRRQLLKLSGIAAASAALPVAAKQLFPADYTLDIAPYALEALRRISGHPEKHGILKDTVLVASQTEVDVEFTADNPGLTLFHCHQQDHMDMGFMMLSRYA
jgi:hypothetical protein